MKVATLLLMVAGLVLAPVWGVPPAEACEKCPCWGGRPSQVSQVIRALPGAGGGSQTAAALVKSNGAMTTASKLAQAVTRRLGTSRMFGISTPIYWR
jgi:hypothetical protein